MRVKQSVTVYSPCSLLRTTTYLLLIIACLSLTGCATTEGMFSSWSVFGSGEEKEEKFDSAEKLIMQGMEAYKIGRYNTAMKHFQEIKDRYPFSPEALLAELKLADCEYYNDNYEEAKELYKEFEERHPANEAIPYVMFQISMCDYSRTDRIDRDSTGAQDAIKSFSRLLRTYPDSPYTREAKARIRAAREFIVNHEYYVAVFYVRTKKYDQAKHRLKYILTMYPDASIIPKAKALQERLAAGDPPKWGLDKWLPKLTMPDWNLADIGIGTQDDEIENQIEQ
ncbi:outer membrane protein assembly factor BamD [Desulfobulbus sp. N2]|nr:outer membrane protein assembly factor BamD [Desulfobulbus sp. US4]MCW5204750.1 outer membrane protein assembly factor BamD [Desulfobulbus sp. N2]WLE96315.1 MAG: outer membrane protein assembly factor BamD [Candidatus Electrothrix communis]